MLPTHQADSYTTKLVTTLTSTFSAYHQMLEMMDQLTLSNPSESWTAIREQSAKLHSMRTNPLTLVKQNQSATPSPLAGQDEASSLSKRALPEQGELFVPIPQKKLSFENNASDSSAVTRDHLGSDGSPLILPIATERTLGLLADEEQPSLSLSQ